jgi:hypothetical protein
MPAVRTDASGVDLPATVFVDRDRELAALAAVVREVARGAGVVVSVEGAAGIGKTTLLKAFAERQAAASGVVFLTVTCHAQVGEFAAYGPFLDLLGILEQTRPRARLRRLSGRAARVAAPELLSLVPALGPVLKMTAEMLASAVPGAPMVDPGAAARMVAHAVLRAVSRYPTAVLIVDDAHRIDASSCAVVSYLAEACADQPLMVVLAGRDDELADNTVARQTVEDLHVRGRLHRLRLGGLPEEAIAEFGRLVMGVRVEPSEVRELARRTVGHPLTLHYYLAEHKARPALPGADAALLPLLHSSATGRPVDHSVSVLDRVATVIRMRLRRLDDSDLRLLSIAAVQGEIFLSTVVADVAAADLDLVATRLHRLAADTGLIQALDPGDWAEEAGSDSYRFEHGLLHQVLYEDQSRAQRRERHRRIAAILARMVDDWPRPPQELLLEIAQHWRAGGDPVAAGRGAHVAACALAATGASVREVAAICRQGLDDIGRAAAGPEVSRLRAQLIELLLAASELDWSAQPRSGGTNPIEELSRAAIAAADQADDPDLRVRVRYLHGKVLLYTRGLTEALGPLGEAWETALASGDPVSILLAGCEYGRQLPKVDVPNGLGVLRRTYELAVHDASLNASDDPVVARARDMVALQLGVNLFDAGELGEALQRLRAGIDRVRRGGTLGLLPIGLNYLVQVELATGDVDAAEALLREAAALTDGTDGDDWHAVNLAYLGWLLVVRHDDLDGLRTLEQARAETARRWQANLAPLVANLYAASLLHVAPRDPAAYDAADRVLTETIEETRRTGMVRSEVTALSLLARLRLAGGDLDAAREAGREAVAHLERVGWKLAAVCVEEILYHHSVVLRAAGDTASADEALRRARAEVERKSLSLPGDARDRYLDDVPVNRLITA